MELAQRKRRLRHRMLQRCRALEASAVDQAGDRVAQHLARSAEFAGAERLVLYAALPHELPSRPCFDAAREAGKPVLLPRAVSGGVLEFAACEAWEDLQPGRYGVLEPAPARPARNLEGGDLVLVPGVAFDAAGNRLGRGKGYWDRTLSRHRWQGVRLVGVGFAFQLISQVPHGPEDRSMDAILTDAGWHWPRPGAGA